LPGGQAPPAAQAAQGADRAKYRRTRLSTESSPRSCADGRGRPSAHIPEIGFTRGGSVSQKVDDPGGGSGGSDADPESMTQTCCLGNYQRPAADHAEEKHICSERKRAEHQKRTQNVTEPGLPQPSVRQPDAPGRDAAKGTGKPGQRSKGARGKPEALQSFPRDRMQASSGEPQRHHSQKQDPGAEVSEGPINPAICGAHCGTHRIAF